MNIKRTLAAVAAALISTVLISCKPEPVPTPPEDDGKEDVKPDDGNKEEEKKDEG